MLPIVALSVLAASAAADEVARIRKAKEERTTPLREIIQRKLPSLSGARPGERSLARLASRIVSIWEDPEFFWSWRVAQELAELGWSLPEESPDPRAAIDTYLERIDRLGLDSSLSENYEPIADLLGLRPGDVLARDVIVPSDPRQRSSLAEAIVARAAEVIDAPGENFRSDLPVWVRTALVEERLRQSAGFSTDLAGRVRLVSPEESAAFIDQHHSALPVRNFRGALYDLGLEIGGRLVAVATATTPTGALPIEDSAHLLEVSRVASDGTVYGAASALVSKMIDLVDLSRRYETTRPGLLITYSLLSELGTTYKALEDKGLRPVAFVVAKKAQAKSSSRSEIAAKANVPKIRWEAGAEAAPADKTLLRLARPYRKFVEEGRKLDREDLKPLNMERLRDLHQALTGTRPRISRHRGAPQGLHGSSAERDAELREEARQAELKRIADRDALVVALLALEP